MSLGQGATTTIGVILVLGMVGWLALSPKPEAPPVAAPKAKVSDSAKQPGLVIATREELDGNRVITKRKSPALGAGGAPGSPADKLRDALMALHAGGLSEEPSVPGPRADADARLAAYTRELMAEHLAPMVSECYERLLEREPTAAGPLQLNFSLMGDANLGSAVVDAKLSAGGGLNHDSFTTCVSDAMLAAILPALPDKRRGVTIKQALELAP